MEKRNNSAGRLYRIFHEMLSYHDNTAMRDVWKKVLGVNDTKKSLHEISRKLELIIDELDQAHATIKASNISTNLYETAFQSAYKLTSFETITGLFSDYKRFLSEAFFTSFGFCTEITSDEPNEFTKEQLTELLADTYDLWEKVEKGDLPASVKNFVYNQLNIIRDAINNSKIIGAKAFKKGLDEAMPWFAEFREEVAPYGNTEEITQLMEIMQKSKQYGGTNVDRGGYDKTITAMIEAPTKMLALYPSK